MSERALMLAILAALGSRRDIRLWRQNTGVGRTFSGNVVKYGVGGGGDLSGILSDGKRLEVEVKTPTGRQTRQQRAFQSMINLYGGVYIVARSPEDALKQLRDRGYCGGP